MLVLVALALPIIGFVGWWVYARLSGPSVVDNALVGQSEAQIRTAYGPPEQDRPGYQPLALYVPPSLPPGPLRSLVFRPRGVLHPRGGTLCVWLVERDGQWVCFESCWFRDGVVF
jgi:hypothetical protein